MFVSTFTKLLFSTRRYAYEHIVRSRCFSVQSVQFCAVQDAVCAVQDKKLCSQKSQS